MTIARNQVAIGCAERSNEQAILNRARVDEEELLIGHAAIERRETDHTSQAKGRSTAAGLGCRPGNAHQAYDTDHAWRV